MMRVYTLFTLQTLDG